MKNSKDTIIKTSLLIDILNRKEYYEVGFQNIDPDTGESKYTALTLTSTEDNARLLIFCLQQLDEDPNTNYIYTKI